MNNASDDAAPGWGAHPDNGLLRTAVFLIALGVAPTALAQPQTASPDPAVEPAGRIQLALLEHEERTPRRPRPEPKREADKESWSFAFDNDALVPSHRDQDYTYGLSVSYTGRDARDAWYSLNPVLGALDGLFGVDGRAAQRVEGHSVEFGLFGFTPEDKAASTPVYNDRPYASLIYLSQS
ncbi:MAG TPA: hypothetical protein DIW42_10020, partial [Alcanivorax sp.]|nr:hypothetical protein [Alcanivorax sp.]